MKTTTTTVLLAIALLSACKKDEITFLPPAKQDELSQAKIEEIKGIYTIASITSDVALDINNDGVTNTDIYKEISECQYDDTFTITPGVYPNLTFSINRQANSCLANEENIEQLNNFNLSTTNGKDFSIRMPYIIDNLFYTKLVEYSLLVVTDGGFKIKYIDTRYNNASIEISFQAASIK